MRFFSVIVLLLALLTLTPCAQAALVFSLDTGVDGSGAQLPNGTPNTKYVITSAGAAGSFAGVSPISLSTDLPPTYVADNASLASRWIGINSGMGVQGNSVMPGIYTFQCTFSLAGFPANTARLDDVRYAADNKLVDLSINGTSVFSQTPEFAEEFSSFTSLSPSLGAGLFTSGTNTISFSVYNQDGSFNPMAVRLEGEVDALPEPASLGLLALGALPLLSRRRQGGLRK